MNRMFRLPSRIVHRVAVLYLVAHVCWTVVQVRGALQKQAEVAARTAERKRLEAEQARLNRIFTGRAVPNGRMTEVANRLIKYGNSRYPGGLPTEPLEPWVTQILPEKLPNHLAELHPMPLDHDFTARTLAEYGEHRASRA